MTDLAGGRGEILSLAARTGLDLSAEQVERLAEFAGLFLRWNARINLSGVREHADLVQRHFLDAFAAVRFVAPGARVVDVGAGGGLPGIPLALVTAAEFDLCEPTAKKVAFLRTAVRAVELGTRVRVQHRRLTGKAIGDLEGKFDVAYSRATFAPPDWLKLGRLLVRPAGTILVFSTAGAHGCPCPNEALRYAPGREILVFRT